MSQFLIVIARFVFGSIIALATIVSTIVMSPIVLVLWIWKNLTDFTPKK